jgi:hypothetical protein
VLDRLRGARAALAVQEPQGHRYMEHNVQVPKSPPRKITKEEAYLAESAKKTGGGSALAKLLGVTAAAASEWSRVGPILRHLRPRIEEYLGSAEERGW